MAHAVPAIGEPYPRRCTHACSGTVSRSTNPGSARQSACECRGAWIALVLRPQPTSVGPASRASRLVSRLEYVSHGPARHDAVWINAVPQHQAVIAQASSGDSRTRHSAFRTARYVRCQDVVQEVGQSRAVQPSQSMFTRIEGHRTASIAYGFTVPFSSYGIVSRQLTRQMARDVEHRAWYPRRPRTLPVCEARFITFLTGATQWLGVVSGKFSTTVRICSSESDAVSRIDDAAHSEGCPPSLGQSRPTSQ